MFKILIERQLPRPGGSADPIAHLWQLWDLKRGTAPATRRADFDPFSCPDLLGRINLVDIEAGSPTRFRFRLFGSPMDDPIENDMTSRTVGDIKEPAYADLVQRHYFQAFRLWQPVFSEVKAETECGDHLHYCRLVLPMTSDADSLGMLLVASVRYSGDFSKHKTSCGVEMSQQKGFRYASDDPNKAHLWMSN